MILKKIPTVLKQMSQELPGFLLAAVVNRDDGLSIAELSLRPNVEAAAASAYLASIVKSNAKAIKLLGGAQLIDDILITTDQYHFIIREMPSLPFFLFVMTEKSEWLGRAKLLVRKYETRLMELLAARLSDI